MQHTSCCSTTCSSSVLQAAIPCHSAPLPVNPAVPNFAVECAADAMLTFWQKLQAEAAQQATAAQEQAATEPAEPAEQEAAEPAEPAEQAPRCSGTTTKRRRKRAASKRKASKDKGKVRTARCSMPCRTSARNHAPPPFPPPKCSGLCTSTASALRGHAGPAPH